MVDSVINERKILLSLEHPFIVKLIKSITIIWKQIIANFLKSIKKSN